MSYNYFRNLKRQTQVDNRPRYLRYGDIFVSNKDNINNNQQDTKYNNKTNNTCDNNINYSKYNNNNDNINYSDDSYDTYDNDDFNYNKYNSRSSTVHGNSNNIKYNNNNSNVYDNNNYSKYSKSYAPNFSTATITKGQVSDLDAANIDRVRATNQINRNNSQYKDNYDDIYDDIDYINYNNQQKIKSSRSREQQIYDNSDAYDNYFFNNSNGRVNYQKRQLPPLQQKYASRNSQYDLQYDNKYWEDYDPYQSKRNNKKTDTSLSFKFIWQKFVITFTSILSIVCMAWIAYHWHSTSNASNGSNNAPELIEPDKPSFKVLPDTIGGIDIPYQDKSIYSRVDPTFNQKVQEKLIVPQEVPVDIPTVPTVNKNDISTNTTPVEEYSIVDEKDYYVKCPIDGDQKVATNQLNILQNKLSTFPDGDMLANTTCAIRTVANKQGKRGKFILIGPFCDNNTAKQIGHFCKIKGEIITVKKSNMN